MGMYRGSEAYDFSLFEGPAVRVPARSAAPARKPQPARRPAPRQQTRRPVRQEAAAARPDAEVVAVPSSLKKAIALLLVFFSLWIGVLLLQAQNETVTNQISEVQDQIDIAEGEKVRLTAELNSMFSNEKVDEYATKKLGMVKADSSQIIYIDLTEGDEILLSGDRTVSDAGDEGASKLKELFAYLF